MERVKKERPELRPERTRDQKIMAGDLLRYCIDCRSWDWCGKDCGKVSKAYIVRQRERIGV